MKKIHEGHLGITKCQLRAKACVYWPGVNKEIEEYVKGCEICTQYQRQQTSEPLMPHEIPKMPWDTIGTDLFFFDNDNYLIVADYYSKFPLVRKIRGRCDSYAIVRALKEIFGEQGIPRKVISDNGPQFASATFSDFAKEWCFDHLTSSPRYPQSNGFAERNVQTVKNIFKKARQANSDVDMALLCFRSTPVDNLLQSPAEMLNGRKYRSNMPTRIVNKLPDKNMIHQRLEHRQTSQKRNHDTPGVRELPNLSRGQHVTVLNEGEWIPAVMTDTCVEQRS